MFFAVIGLFAIPGAGLVIGAFMGLPVGLGVGLVVLLVSALVRTVALLRANRRDLRAQAAMYAADPMGEPTLVMRRPVL